MGLQNATLGFSPYNVLRVLCRIAAAEVLHPGTTFIAYSDHRESQRLPGVEYVVAIAPQIFRSVVRRSRGPIAIGADG